jgi:hypothetical protein
MTAPNDETQRLMAVAAELRAAGSSWEVVAREMNRDVRTIRFWVEEFPKLWRRLLRAAERRHEQDARLEARLILRGLLREGDQKAKLSAASQLIKTRPKGRRPEKAAQLSDEDADLAAYISLVRGMTDDELRHSLDDDAKADQTMRELDSQCQDTTE